MAYTVGELKLAEIKDRQSAVQKLHKLGLRQIDIAKKLNVTSGTVSRDMKVLNLKPNGGQGKRKSKTKTKAKEEQINKIKKQHDLLNQKFIDYEARDQHIKTLIEQGNEVPEIAKKLNLHKQIIHNTKRKLGLSTKQEQQEKQRLEQGKQKAKQLITTQDLSDNQIALRCQISPDTVTLLRKDITDGLTYTEWKNQQKAAQLWRLVFFKQQPQQIQQQQQREQQS